MLVKNNIAQPGEVKSVSLDPQQVEVRLRSGEVMHYKRKYFEALITEPERTEGDKDE